MPTLPEDVTGRTRAQHRQDHAALHHFFNEWEGEDGMPVVREEIALRNDQDQAFNITTGLVTVEASGEQLLAAMANPSGSGVNVFLDVGEFGSSADTTFLRYRGATLSGLSNPISGLSMAGTGTVSAVRMYAPPNFGFTGGVVSKTAHIAAYEQYLTHLGGRAKLPPGFAIVWTIVGPGGLGGAMTASVYFEFWEEPI